MLGHNSPLFSTFLSKISAKINDPSLRKKTKNHNDVIFILILGWYLKDTIKFLVKNEYLVHFLDKIPTHFLQEVNFWKKSDF